MSYITNDSSRITRCILQPVCCGLFLFLSLYSQLCSALHFSWSHTGGKSLKYDSISSGMLLMADLFFISQHTGTNNSSLNYFHHHSLSGFIILLCIPNVIQLKPFLSKHFYLFFFCEQPIEEKYGNCHSPTRAHIGAQLDDIL